MLNLPNDGNGRKSSLRALEAEQAVIGAIFVTDDPDLVIERLRPEHFSEGAHQRLWSAVLSVRRKGALDMLGVHSLIEQDEAYQALGGMAYLADLVDHASAWMIEAHAELILERAARRAIVALGHDAVKAGENTAEGTADTIQADLERALGEIAKDGTSRPSAVPAGLTALDNIEAAYRGDFIGTSVGLKVLDDVTGGIRQDDVWIIGGRSSMGKSVCGLALAKGISEQNRGVMMFSLEMPLREVQARLVADLSFDPNLTHDFGNLRYGDILKGRGDDRQRDRARQAARRLASLPIAVNDTGGLTIDDIRVQAQRQLRAWEKAGVQRGAILIDHIGLVRPSRRMDSKAAETADTVNELKSLAKYLKAPIIALCQVNRNTESRNDKRPTLADLNWSGSIEQIADFICLLYREAYYLDRSSNSSDQIDAMVQKFNLELLIHKNRSGPICNIKAFIDVASNAVRDLPDQQRGWA